MYDYFIVGGGISGLYMYTKLREQSENIMLVEESDYFGGRIYQYHDNEVSFPAGAARFNKYHTRVVSLMKQFQLLDFRKNRESVRFAFIDDANEFNKSLKEKMDSCTLTKFYRRLTRTRNNNYNNGLLRN